jgi:hypothetical protein
MVASFKVNFALVALLKGASVQDRDGNLGLFLQVQVAQFINGPACPNRSGP